MISEFYTSLYNYLNTNTAYDVHFGVTKGLKGEYVNIFHIAKKDDLPFFECGTGETALRYSKIMCQINCSSTSDGNVIGSQLDAMQMASTISKKLYKIKFYVDDARIVDQKELGIKLITEGVNETWTYAITFEYWLGSDFCDSSTSSESSESSESSFESSSSSEPN